MNRLTFLTSCTAICLALSAALPGAAEKKKNVLDIEKITDTNIIYPEANFEAESRKMLESWYMQNYMATDDRYMTREDIATSDAVYRQRLSELPTVIEMPFNQVVKSHIERYTKKGRPMVASILALSNYYMPIFEQALEEAGLPLELKYLPVIESALEPNAVSKSGATGLWQFMLASAKGLNMEVNSLVDERRDPYVSSRCAAKFLGDLYRTYGDWSLAIAAYNCGPGTVNKALRRAGGDPSSHDYWAIYNYLPQETRGYVPAFIAANYVMNHYKDHNISPVIPKRPLVTDTLHIDKRVHFNQISQVLDIPVEELRMLNPQFRADIIPGTPSKHYNLILPSQQVHAYIMSEEDILAYESEKYARRMDAEPGRLVGEALVEETFVEETEKAPSIYEEMSQAPTMKKEETSQTRDRNLTADNSSSRTIGPSDPKVKTHKVEPGESLSSIAAKYGVGPEDLKRWNNLRRNAIRIGQVLRIADTSAKNAGTAVAEAPSRKSENATRKTEKTETAAVPAKKADSSYRKKAAAEDTAQSGGKKKNKANTATAQTTARKGADKDKETGKKRGRKGASEAAAAREHTVVSGESYDRIAKKYGVTTEELKKANNATSDMIKPDQKLKIPKKSASSSKETTKASPKSSSKSASKSSGAKKSNSTAKGKKKKK
ncbi:MAG: LysM peptidoglycan-binding domain-containing protein [Muribaculaceae bacterium]|nr:LysM peptidoglycan-binding domain-containing protein [Muribaculaceae bacterium]